MPILRPSAAKATMIANRVLAYFPDQLTATPFEFEGMGFYVQINAPGQQAGLVLHPDELDNGASGLKEEALKRLACFRDGVAYTPPAPRPGISYDDVMTTTSGLGS